MHSCAMPTPSSSVDARRTATRCIPTGATSNTFEPSEYATVTKYTVRMVPSSSNSVRSHRIGLHNNPAPQPRVGAAAPAPRVRRHRGRPAAARGRADLRRSARRRRAARLSGRRAHCGRARHRGAQTGFSSGNMNFPGFQKCAGDTHIPAKIDLDRSVPIPIGEGLHVRRPALGRR